jgi:hypothetical protein
MTSSIAHAELANDVDSGFVTEGHAGLEQKFVSSHQIGIFMPVHGSMS